MDIEKRAAESAQSVIIDSDMITAEHARNLIHTEYVKAWEECKHYYGIE